VSFDSLLPRSERCGNNKRRKKDLQEIKHKRALPKDPFGIYNIKQGSGLAKTQRPLFSHASSNPATEMNEQFIGKE